MTDQATTLRGDALGVGESIVMGTAGSGPAYSVSAAMATLIAAVGVLSPASLIYCGFIMFGIVLAFQQLNKLDPDAGASFVWVRTVFSPALGFLAGWSMLISSGLFMVSGSIPAATATLALIAPQYVDKLNVVSGVAAVWVLVIGAIVAKGIKLTSYTQILFTVVEVGVLLLLIGLGFAHAGLNPAHRLSLDWFTGAGFTPRLFATGSLTALFLYAGWDVTSNLNEETRNAERNAGLGSIFSVAIVVALFVAFSVVTLLLLSDDEIAAAGTNVPLVIARKLLPGPWADVAVIAVMVSTVGALETSILQFTRTLFSMSRAGVMNPRYARLHRHNRTPFSATLLVTILGLVLLLLSSCLHSVNVVIKDSINAIGFQMTVYYGLAGLACAWVCRRQALASLKGFVLLLAWPLLGAGFLFFAAIYSVPTFDLTTNIVGLGGIVIGIVPWLLNRRRRAANAIA